MALGEGTRVQIMAPVIRGKKGEHVKIFEDARRSGYVRVRADGNMYDLSENSSKRTKSTISRSSSTVSSSVPTLSTA